MVWPSETHSYTNTKDHKSTSLTCLITLERSNQDVFQESNFKLTKTTQNHIKSDSTRP
jgi:hypothetical protein